MIIFSMEALRSTRSYDEDFVSALRDSSASVLVAICHNLCAYLRGEFTLVGH